jgi:hypothetical protein
MSIHYELKISNKVAGVDGYSGKIYDPIFLEKNIISKTSIFLSQSYFIGKNDELL